jgi:hypothetical protein
MDKSDLKRIVSKKTVHPNIISVGVTWVDGRCLFKEDTKWSKAWYGVCHYSKMIFAITPIDFQYPKTITTIGVAPIHNYCDREKSCLNFLDCKMNKFSREGFGEAFKDCGTFSLGMPLNIGSERLWFNDGKWKVAWENFIIPVDGGILAFKENSSELVIL